MLHKLSLGVCIYIYIYIYIIIVTSVACVLLLAQVLPHPQLIFPSKPWFFGIYLNFQPAEIT